jgi:protein O-mannosyl-transferase
MKIKNKKPQNQQPRKTFEVTPIDFSKNRKETILPVIIVLVLVLIAYFPTFFNGFTNWDDDLQVTTNADITSLSLHNLKNIFSSYYVGMYQPIATLSFAVIFKFFGLNAFAYHFFSLILHLVNTFLVYKIVMKLTEKKEIIWGVILLFALNPMQVEAVAWVSATSTLLYSMFFLLSVNTYLNFLQNTTSKKKYYISFLFFFFALLSKSAAVTLPLILLLCDYFLHAKISKKDLLNKIPFFVLSVIFGILTVIGRTEAGHVFNIAKEYNFFDRILFIIYSLSFYIISIFLPFKMSAFHSYPDKSGEMLPVIFYLTPLLLIGITLFLVKVKKYKKEIIFGMGFFLLSISIMIELIPVGTQIVKERYTYIPCIGLYFAFFTFLSTSFDKNERWKKFLNYGIVTLSIIFIALSFVRTQTWNDSLSLWNDVIKKYPECSVAYNNRGNYYNVHGANDKAINDYTKAIELEQNYDDAYYNRGVTYGNQKLFDKAINDYTKVIEFKPDYAEAYNNRGSIYEAQGLYDKAMIDYSKAIELNPDFAKAYYNRGVVYDDQKLFDKAINDYTKAIELKPDYAEAFYNRGIICSTQGISDKAINDYSKAIELKPDYAEAYFNRGIIYDAQGIYNKAINDYSKAIELKPDYTDAYNNLGVEYYNQGFYDKAIEDYTKAIELNPNYTDAYNNRGVAYYTQKLFDKSCQDFQKAAELGSKDAKDNLTKVCK